MELYKALQSNKHDCGHYVVEKAMGSFEEAIFINFHHQSRGKSSGFPMLWVRYQLTTINMATSPDTIDFNILAASWGFNPPSSVNSKNNS